MWLMAAADLNRFTAVDGDGSNVLTSAASF